MLIQFAIPTTKAQRAAIKRLYDRCPIVMGPDGETHHPERYPNAKPLSYRAFRGRVHQSHMGCLMVRWQGMWIGIEPDGYTHS